MRIGFRTRRLPLLLSALLAAVLAGLSAPVAALGLGQVQVLSRSGEPLLAEIPIVSSDPRELEQLQARLASPETFRRIGLEPPQGAAADLRFSVALDARGNPVVRVTSPAPIDQPLLTFLLEVDWGQGRLVREYSVLVDAPQSAVAVGQPDIQAPLPAPASTVVRPADTPQVQSEPLADAPPTAEPVAPDTTQPPQVEPAPIPVVQQPPAVPAPAPATPGELGPVQRGQTLSEIASGIDRGGFTLNQSMLALLRANPDAFIDGNINLLREGAVLRMPGRDVLAELSPSEANAVVRAQVRTWRERQAPPVVAADAVAGDATDSDSQSSARDGDAEAAVADARLEIVPPVGDGQAPGSRSGTSAGGEGDMVRNELRQAKETLAARDAEAEELRARVAELEDLQRKQAELLDLKDSELAAVQQRLAEARTGQEATAEATTGAAQAQPQAPASSLPWLFGGVLLLVVAGVAWSLRRRRPVPAAASPAPQPRRNYDTAAMAATLADAGRDETARAGPGVAPAPAPAAKAGPAAAPAPRPVAPVAAAAPTQGQVFPMPDAAPAAETIAPTWHGGTPGNTPAAPVVPLDAKAQQQASGRDGLELARAYLDLGDHQAARTLLREVLLGRDPNAREEAARLLRELG